MLPPRFPVEDWCQCAEGRHLNRFLAQGETPAEDEIVKAFYNALRFAWHGEIVEANRRFLGPDPTSEENWKWVRETEDRELDHIYEATAAPDWS